MLPEVSMMNRMFGSWPDTALPVPTKISVSSARDANDMAVRTAEAARVRNRMAVFFMAVGSLDGRRCGDPQPRHRPGLGVVENVQAQVGLGRGLAELGVIDRLRADEVAGPRVEAQPQAAAVRAGARRDRAAGRAREADGPRAGLDAFLDRLQRHRGGGRAGQQRADDRKEDLAGVLAHVRLSVHVTS